MDAISLIFVQIEKSNIGPLKESVWNFDQRQTENVLQGILNINDVVDVEVFDAENKSIHKKSKPAKGSSFVEQNFLLYDGKSEQAFGRCYVRVTKENLYKRLVDKIIYFTITQSIKTMIISFLIFLVFQFLITRHIVALTRHIMGVDLSSMKPIEKASLKRSAKDDEITYLNDVLFEQFEKVRLLSIDNMALLKEKDEIIQQKDLASIQSARLAALGEMAGNIAHEINNPLAIIQGYTDLLIDSVESSDSKKTKEHCENIQRHSQRLYKIVQSLLQLTKDSKHASKENCDISEIVEHVLNITKVRIKDLGITLEQNILDKSFWISCNKTAIGQVILNLINNAIDALEGSESGKIAVEIWEHANGVAIHVIDNGPGVPKELEKKIFDPFFTTKTAKKGTGLGLSLSIKIVENHGGKLTYERRNEESHFIVWLP